MLGNRLGLLTAAFLTAALCLSAGTASETGNPRLEGRIPEAGGVFASAAAAVADSTDKWGYGYDSLLLDLERWRQHPEVRIDSIGASVQGRAIWMVSITDASDSLGPVDDSSSRKRRIFMHARTHPAEVQAHYVAKEAIHMLLDTGALPEELRRAFIFNIIPMYNPDGVELGYARQNAHGVDLEGNWDDGVMEPEATALKRQFEAFQASPVRIEVALNLHSDKNLCSRFFVFHYAAGTSSAYEALERQYIGAVQDRFPGGIEDWTFNRTWATGTGIQYPEGFWWQTEREKVIALTYEDTNCPGAGLFDSTARALVLGSVDYIRARMYVLAVRAAHRVSRTLLVAEGVRITGAAPGSRWRVDDIRGRLLAGGILEPGAALLTWRQLQGATAAPVRILSILYPGGIPERIRLPLRE